MEFKGKELSPQYCQSDDRAGRDVMDDKDDRWRLWIKDVGVLTIAWMSLAMGLSMQTPVQAQMPDQVQLLDQAQLDQVQTDQQEQSRIAKLQRLQAGIASSERISPPSQISQTQRDPDLNQQIYSHYSPPLAMVAANGVYLYGQQPVRDQLAIAYLIFEAHNGEVVGAFYMPSSSFDCVRGQMDAEKLALTVMDSYSQETSPYALTLSAPVAEVAYREGALAPPPNIDGFYPLSVNAQDLELLATCQAKAAN